MLESTFLEDWDRIGTKMAQKGHLLPKSGINSELVSIQRVKGAGWGELVNSEVWIVTKYGLIDDFEWF